MHNNEGEIIGIMGISHDITDLKQTQDEIMTKKNELENYLYIASHDLRSPMVNIQGFSQRLQKQSETIREMVANCKLEGESKDEIEKLKLTKLYSCSRKMQNKNQ